MDAVVDKRWRAIGRDRNPGVTAAPAGRPCIAENRVRPGHAA